MGAAMEAAAARPEEAVASAVAAVAEAVVDDCPVRGASSRDDRGARRELEAEAQRVDDSRPRRGVGRGRACDAARDGGEHVGRRSGASEIAREKAELRRGRKQALASRHGAAVARVAQAASERQHEAIAAVKEEVKAEVEAKEARHAIELACMRVALDDAALEASASLAKELDAERRRAEARLAAREREVEAAAMVEAERQLAALREKEAALERRSDELKEWVRRQTVATRRVLARERANTVNARRKADSRVAEVEAAAYESAASKAAAIMAHVAAMEKVAIQVDAVTEAADEEVARSLAASGMGRAVPSVEVEVEARQVVAEAPLVEMAEAEEAVMARLASKGRPMDHGGVWRQPKLPLPTAPELSPLTLGAGHGVGAPPTPGSLTDMIEQARVRCSDEVQEISEEVLVMRCAGPHL